MKRLTGRKIRKIAMSTAAIFTVFSLTGCSLLMKTYLPALTQRDTNTGNENKTINAMPEPAVGESYEMDQGAYAMSSVLTDQYMMGSAPGEVFVPDWNTEEYSYVKENGWCSTLASPFSTFAADVDTASYANVRRMLLAGDEVVKDAVRIEEFINYFDYHYPAAKDGEPFSVTTQIAPCPWNSDTQLLLIGLKAREIEEKERAASNLVFLVDVSGSMSDADKLPLVQRAFRLLINELDENDTISIVTYASSDRVVLDGVHGDEKSTVCEAVEDLMAGGGTNGSDGLNTAYELAEKHFIEGGNNRVILATDGDLNICFTDEGSLTRLIEEKAKSGVTLSVLGFGRGNISDTNMEALADHGNGNYSYIDSIQEARRVLVDEAGSTLFTVAKDVKLQVEFNPAKVKGYRLIGYENRTMAAEDFADDTKDGGEIGSGHTVTALYEIAGVDSSQQITNVESRYGVQGNTGMQESMSAQENAPVPESESVEENTSVSEQNAATAEEETVDESEETVTENGTTEVKAAENVDIENEWGILHIRYKEPDGDESILIDTIIDDSAVADEMSDDMSWAAGVAQAGMVLKGSEYAGTTDLAQVRERLKSLTGNDTFREEFIYLLTRM